MWRRCKADSSNQQNRHLINVQPTLFDSYESPSEVYDESHKDGVQVAREWSRLVSMLNGLGSHELSRRSEQARRRVYESRRVYENGVTYNVHGDAKHQRPWEIDLVPLLFSSQEWNWLSEALEQRARLLDFIIRDVFGPNTLLKRGLLPPEVIYAHPGFLRPILDVRPTAERYLDFYGVELARSPNGDWWVMADRTSMAYGAGYALENRLVVSRMLPDTIHELGVERLAPFFSTLQETLSNLSPTQRENPRIVILSRGPRHPFYFEDAYLARYLGVALVEGGDLTVRNDHVFLKTLGGLLPVDVIFRRVDDPDCDPLELRENSSLGITGLTNAIRQGNVAVSNALGSGLAESPVFMAFLPRICEEVFGEPLKLPSIATWWCQHDSARDYVLDHLEDLVVKPAYRYSGQDEIIVQELSKKAVSDLATTIQSQPHQFVAQENVQRSAAPMWRNGQFTPGYVAMRTFLAASGDGYKTMPGGLIRTASGTGPLELSIGAGDSSKDAWICVPNPDRSTSKFSPKVTPMKLVRGGTDLPSRDADNLYWLGRQLERADSSARLLRTLIDRVTSESTIDLVPEASLLLNTLVQQEQINVTGNIVELKTQLPSIERAIPQLILNSRKPMSLKNSLAELHRLAAVARHRISSDNWRVINRIDHEFHQLAETVGVELPDVLTMLEKLIIHLVACGGLAAQGMTHSFAWRFLDIGRRIELSLQIVSLIRHSLLVCVEHETAVLQALLDIRDCKMTYRSRYLASITTAAVLDLLLTDETNPRSLVTQLSALCEHVQALPHSNGDFRGPDKLLAMSLLHWIQMTDVEQLYDTPGKANHRELDDLLAQIELELNTLSRKINRYYFVHASPSHQLAATKDHRIHAQ